MGRDADDWDKVMHDVNICMCLCTNKILARYRIGPFFFLTSLHGSPSQYHKKWVDGIGECELSSLCRHRFIKE